MGSLLVPPRVRSTAVFSICGVSCCFVAALFLILFVCRCFLDVGVAVLHPQFLIPKSRLWLIVICCLPGVCSSSFARCWRLLVACCS